MATIAPRFAGIQQFEQCLNGARMTPFGFDSNGDLAVDSENDAVAVAAIQGALNDLQYGLSVTGNFDGATESAVRQFKSDQMLAVPAGLAAHDGVVGPGTSGRLNELFTPPPVPSVPVTPTPPPPALDAWNHLVSFRPPAAMQASVERTVRSGRHSSTRRARDRGRTRPDQPRPLPRAGRGAAVGRQHDHDGRAVAGARPSQPQPLRRRIAGRLQLRPRGSRHRHGSVVATLPPDGISRRSDLDRHVSHRGSTSTTAAVVLSEVSTDHWIFSTIWTPEDGGHPVSGNREFGFAPSSAEEVIFYTRGADRTTSVADSLGEATVFGAAHQLWLSFQRRLAAYVNSNGGLSHGGASFRDPLRLADGKGPVPPADGELEPVAEARPFVGRRNSNSAFSM